VRIEQKALTLKILKLISKQKSDFRCTNETDGYTVNFNDVFLLVI